MLRRTGGIRWKFGHRIGWIIRNFDRENHGFCVGVFTKEEQGKPHLANPCSHGFVGQPICESMSENLSSLSCRQGISPKLIDRMVNRGHARLKGGYGFGFHNHAERLRVPMRRNNGRFEEISWDAAYECIVGKLNRIMASHGPQAIGGIASSCCTNEENYLLQKFIRAVIGCNNIDSCARLCHSPSVFGMQQSFGTGAATNGFEDVEQASCIMMIGANPTEAHPVVGAQIRQRVMKGVPLIVIDPRKIELSSYAKYHLQLRPGTNLAVLNLMARFILDEGLVDWDFVAQRCENWEVFEDGLRKLDIAEVERVSGVGRDLIRAAALAYANAGSAMCFHGSGVTEHEQGAKTVMVICNLAMMTGNIGRPGVGVNPLHGQNHVQGATDMGCQPNQGPGYVNILEPSVRNMLGAMYGVELCGEPGLNLPEMMDSALSGTFKGLWLVGEDLVRSNLNSAHVKRALASLEFLIVQDLFFTDTCKFADIILPAASFFEKSGTFTNAERRVKRVIAAIRPVADTRSACQVICDVMRRFGYPQEDCSPCGVLAEIARAVPFLRGVTWGGLGDSGKQWPILDGGVDTPILHVDHFTRGLGRFHFFPWRESSELVMHGEAFPFLLTTGRVLPPYNCGMMVRHSGNKRIAGGGELSIHPADAKRKCIHHGDFVRLRSARGEVFLRARITDEVRTGVFHATFDFPEPVVNQLTGGGHDEETKCPESKLCAVDVERADWLPGNRDHVVVL